jgi:hypothetical protein
VEKLPVGNFLDFPFLQARGGPRGVPAGRGHEAGRPEAQSCRPATWPTAIHHGVAASFVLPKTYGSYWHLRTISPVKVTAREFQGAFGSWATRRDIRWLSLLSTWVLARVIVGASQGARPAPGSTVKLIKERMEAVRTARRSGNRRTSTPSLRSVWRFLNLSPTSSSARAPSGIASIWGATRARETDRAPLSHVPVLPITRGLPEHPCLCGRNRTRGQTLFRLHDTRSRSFSPDGTNSSGLAPICPAAGCPRRFAYLRHVSARIVRDHQRAFGRSSVSK